jgi:hypothetical protein
MRTMSRVVLTQYVRVFWSGICHVPCGCGGIDDVGSRRCDARPVFAMFAADWQNADVTSKTMWICSPIRVRRPVDSKIGEGSTASTAPG